MSSFVLVHGGWAGAWCWEKVAPLLREQGHAVAALDLPGHGQDTTPLRAISLQSYVDRVVEVLDQRREPAILVGHSSGGIVISQAAEQRPQQVRALVYLCAYHPGDGESLVLLGQRDPSPERNIMRYLELSPDQRYATLKPEGIRPALVHDCEDHDARWFETRVRTAREPFAPVVTPLQLTPEKYGRIPRFYVETLQDQALSPALQQQMYTAQPCTVITMDTGHAPHLAQPRELVGHLISIGNMVRLPEAAERTTDGSPPALARQGPARVSRAAADKPGDVTRAVVFKL